MPTIDTVIINGEVYARNGSLETEFTELRARYLNCITVRDTLETENDRLSQDCQRTAIRLKETERKLNFANATVARLMDDVDTLNKKVKNGKAFLPPDYVDIGETRYINKELYDYEHHLACKYRKQVAKITTALNEDETND